MKREVLRKCGRENDSKSMHVLIEVLTTFFLLSSMLTHLHVGYLSIILGPMIIILNMLMACTKH